MNVEIIVKEVEVEVEVEVNVPPTLFSIFKYKCHLVSLVRYLCLTQIALLRFTYIQYIHKIK